MEDDVCQLDSYQRGNRDGLESFARWAEKMENELKEEANRLELKACENGILARDNVRISITSLRHKANAFQHAANKARSMSRALPLDPQEKE